MEVGGGETEHGRDYMDLAIIRLQKKYWCRCLIPCLSCELINYY